jgi:hypothetical protein
MYLSKRTYVKNWEHMGPDKQNKITLTTGGQNNASIKTNRISDVIEEVMYWRKANSIHAWFVENVQEGTDDCKEYWVGVEKLQELIDLCSKVVETKDASLLPPQTGFFFGSQEVDDWYFIELADTIKTLTEDLEHHQNTNARGDYYYQSSW